ncbi:homologous-pairing protein 2 homolog [Haliotis rubra]|uniref:homologous-pairing protein 2 homolog n=1 Tax=Haliotis rubra TaxID=36100 RepID=UPI001EE5EB63|nr:homologous-pairing protein 2 homolog [Haliotis rubra]
MSKNKDAAASKAVADYLNRQNRPYSVTDLLNNMGKEYGKTAITKACESLAADGKIREKAYGKQKVYVADQSNFPDVDDAELKSMDAKIVELTESVQQVQDRVRKLESELKTLNNAMSTDDAKMETERIENEMVSLEEKLRKLKEGQVLITPQEKDKVYKERVKYVKEWKKRKRISTDIINAILEGYPKTKKHLVEEIGLETDEDYSVKPPDI